MRRHYKLRSSRLLIVLLLLLAAGALVCLWLLPLPVPVLLILTVLVSCWAGYHLLLDARLRLGRSCVAFRLEEEGKIVLVLRNGWHLQGYVQRGSLVTPYLVILNVLLDEHRRRRNLLILPGAMSADSFRRLRVVLRWGDGASQPLSP
ncbi:MAG: hypothetical protein Q7U91_17015 [Sideroxyarcus sp.]|nr:hypothetical protein [Sideroxyarcus sp.]